MANIHDSQRIKKLGHGKERRIYQDTAYYSKARKEEFEAKGIAFNVNKKGNLSIKDEFFNRFFSKTRSKVEYIFDIIKDIRGHRKARKGLMKNCQQGYLVLGLANLYRVRRVLAR